MSDTKLCTACQQPIVDEDRSGTVTITLDMHSTPTTNVHHICSTGCIVPTMQRVTAAWGSLMNHSIREAKQQTRRRKH